MSGSWTITYYQSPSGTKPVYEIVESLPLKTKAKVHNTFELLVEYGTKLGPPHARKLTGTPLWELRILGENSIRIMYIATTGKTFILLHSCLKKRQKTQEKDIKTALARLRDYTSRN